MDTKSADDILKAQEILRIKEQRECVMETDKFFNDYAVRVDRRVLVRLSLVSTRIALAHALRGNTGVSNDFDEIRDLIDAITREAVARETAAVTASRHAWLLRLMGGK